MAGQDERFVEVPWANDQTLIYDLRTVHMVQPGRFTELIDKATDLRIRAEIKAGETLKRMALEGDRETGGRAGKRSQSATVKLSDLKISKSDSSRWQQALFDCKRGVWDNYGVPFFGGEEPSEELMQEMMHPDRVKPHTVGHQIYHTICLKVTHETPYSPE
jgi:hypothetical protein